jgi:hypothetical protein
MTTNNSATIIQQLIELNTQIGEMEQTGAAATSFFDELLADQLIFRRTSGKVIGKHAPNSFIESLKAASPFISRRAEDIAVNLVGDRALATLIIIGTRADGSVGRYQNIRLFSRNGERLEHHHKKARKKCSCMDLWLRRFDFSHSLSSLPTPCWGDQDQFSSHRRG